MKAIHSFFGEIGELNDLIANQRRVVWELNVAVNNLILGIPRPGLEDHIKSLYVDLLQSSKTVETRIAELNRKLQDD